jgi:ankyrin repeat protein
VIATCLLWTPVKVWHYKGKFNSGKPEECVAGIKGLLACGEEGEKELLEYLRTDMKDAPVKRRVLVVDAFVKGGQPAAELFIEGFYGGEMKAEFLVVHWAIYNEPMWYDEVDRYPLQIAVERGYRDATEILLAKGADVNVRVVATGSAPLYVAALKGDREMVSILISGGAEVDAKNNYRWTALHVAAMFDRIRVAELLVLKGADLNAAIKDGRTPLHLAAFEGHKELCELLLSKGADVNARDKYGTTPLHSAAAVGHNDVVSLLLDRGADVNSENSFDETALDRAIGAGERETAELLRARGGMTGKEIRK